MRLGKLNDLVIDVLLEETMTETSDVSMHPVEHGSDITDHVHNNPLTLDIRGVFTAEGSWKKLQELRKMKREKTLINFIGRNISRNLVIVHLNTDHPSNNKFGATFTATLQQVTLVRGKRFGEEVEGVKTQTQTSKRVHQGRQEVMNK